MNLIRYNNLHLVAIFFTILWHMTDCYILSRIGDRPIYATSVFVGQRQSNFDESIIKAPVNEMSLDVDENEVESMYSISYDPLEPPNAMTLARDLEDVTLERALRFFDKKGVLTEEKCYLVGLEDKSTSRVDDSQFSLEESLSELSELAGAAGLTVVGSTFQRVSKPSVEYYIGPGKVKDIAKSLLRHKCCCVIFDAELSPSQQKNLEISFNQDNSNKKSRIKVLDRTALILDIFAQHARTREGQLQIQLALLTYRLPRLTNMWTHLERQSAGARGRSNGGVGLRGPGEKQLESDRRQMKSKISMLEKAIDSVRRHRALHRGRRRRLGAPVVALVGYTNAGKSTVLNSLAGSAGGVLVADMLFATLDPTTRLVQMTGIDRTLPEILLTDTVGFIQKLPTNLGNIGGNQRSRCSSACNGCQQSLLAETAGGGIERTDGLSDKPVVTFWNKADLLPTQKEFLKLEASKRALTVCGSALSGEGMSSLMEAVEATLSSQMEDIDIRIPHDLLHQQEDGLSGGGTLLSAVHRTGSMTAVVAGEVDTWLVGRVPTFLKKQLDRFLMDYGSNGNDQTDEKEVVDMEDQDFDWTALARGRHTAVKTIMGQQYESEED
eukprot:gene8660-17868_t